MRRGIFVLALLGACSGRSCGCGPARVGVDAGEDELEEAGAKLGDDGLAPERCRFEGDPVLLSATSAEVGRLEVGPLADAGATTLALGLASGGRGELVSLTTSARADGTLALALGARTALGVLSGDAPPPRPLLAGAEVYALYYPAPFSDGGTPKGRHLRFAVATGGTLGRAVELPEESLDESLAFDGALREVPGAAPEGLFAWDDDEGDHGVIRVALYQNGTMGEPLTLANTAKSAGDASAPRVRFTGDGWIVFSSVRRADVGADGAPRAASDEALEGPGELRGFEWIEAVKLGLDGKPRGAPQRLTAADGHVGSFDVDSAGPRSRAASGDFDLFTRDAAQRGKLVHVTLRGESVTSSALELPPAAALAPSLFRWTDDATLLAYEDFAGHALLVPIDPARGEPAARPSDEAAFSGTILGALAGGTLGTSGAAAVVLQADKGGAAAASHLRIARCRSF